jgi:hypothetical protein
VLVSSIGANVIFRMILDVKIFYIAITYFNIQILFFLSEAWVKTNQKNVMQQGGEFGMGHFQSGHTVQC